MTTFLDVEHAGVDVLLVTAVVGRRMNVHHERLARKLLGGDAGKVGEPVMGVDDIELVLVLHGDGAAHHGVAGHLLHEVGTVLTRELELGSVNPPERLLLLFIGSADKIVFLVTLLFYEINDSIVFLLRVKNGQMSAFSFTYAFSILPGC